MGSLITFRRPVARQFMACALAGISFFAPKGIAAEPSTASPLPKDQLAASYKKEILPIFETYC
ncbi:MAG TPA: hypothetical protein VM511_05605, partial [Luteolibacter sp.]|nr:hypothetical protein [Luteolibacter sp.]